MIRVVVALSIWLHLLATVVWIGQAVLSGLVYVPLFTEQLRGPALGRAIEGMAKRMMPLIWGSIVVFVITGIPMTTMNPKMPETGVFGSAWSILILVKHIIVLVMIGLAVYMGKVALPGMVAVLTAGAGPPGGAEAAPPRQAPTGEAPAAGPPAHVRAAVGRMQLAGSAVTVCGIVVLLLTAVAEAL